MIDAIIIDRFLSAINAKQVNIISKTEKANARKALTKIRGKAGQESTNKSPEPLLEARSEPYIISECIIPNPIPEAKLEVTSFNGNISEALDDEPFIIFSVLRKAYTRPKRHSS